MAGRLRVRPITIQILAALLLVSLAPALAIRAAAQQYPGPASQESFPTDNRDWSDQIPGHVSAVDGAAELERDGQREAVEENVPLLAGDRLRTARGRVEVLFSDGSALALDQFTNVDLLSDSLLRLETGRIRLAIARGASELAYRVDAAGTTTWLRSAGEYRIAVDDRSTEPEVFVTVLRGAAELESGGGRTSLRTGYEARADARNQPSLPYTANVAAWDEFDRWADTQQRHRTGARSAQYLPAELRHYSGTFDNDGSWEYEQGYGYVWYPTVAVGWRPYYHGGWSFYGSLGWFWVGGGRWNWPTHHYGRWGLKTGRWYWIPGRHWGPAWVSWASAPGYYGWCPLGFDNRAVVSITNVSVYGGHGTPWHGWTVVPASRFGPRYAVNRYSVAPQTINLSGDRFTVHTQAPVRASAIARQVEPLRAPTTTAGAGRYAVPRSAQSSAASVVSGPAAGGGSEIRSSMAGSRSRATTGSPSSVVTTSSERDTSDQARSSTVRSAGPRSRSAPSSPDGGGDPDSSDRPTRSAVPRSSATPAAPPATAPDSGARSAPSSGRSSQPSAGQARRRSSAASPVTSPTPRVIAPRETSRSSWGDRSPAPSYSAGPPRIDRTAPARQEPVDRRASSRTSGSGPTGAPWAERSTQAPASAPASSARSAPNPASSDGSSGGGRQARSRNSR